MAKTDDSGVPNKTVYDHSLQTAYVALAIQNLFDSSFQGILLHEISSLAALHDLGKISPGFQKKLQGKHLVASSPELAAIPLESFCTDHTEIGAAALNSAPFSSECLTDLARIIAQHHGEIVNVFPQNDMGGIYGGKLWRDERQRFIKEMISLFGFLPENKLSYETRKLIAGIITVADWIASDNQFFSNSTSTIQDQAKEALSTCGFLKSTIRPGLSFKEIFSCTPYPVQQAFVDIATSPGLYILEAPMGSGKTEAALYVAYQLMAAGYHHGFYFGLPTRLTSNKIFERVDPFLRKISLDDVPPKLAHSTAWLNYFENGGESLNAGQSWFDPRKRTLLYPYTIGTVDQALMSIMRSKHYFVRSFGLAGKVVILDEVHSYDMYTGTLIEELVESLLQLNSTVIILSATLTDERRRRLLKLDNSIEASSPYPLITSKSKGMICYDAQKVSDQRLHHIGVIDFDDKHVAALAIDKAQEGQCVLCIANTVDRAQKWYDTVLAQRCESDYPVGILHSKYPIFRREEIEKIWINRLGKAGPRPEGCILIATQIVEQSIDIDADYLITELAPTDMLLQRMGRQWRHHQIRRFGLSPETIIVCADLSHATSKDTLYDLIGKSNAYVYSPYVLWRTFKVFNPLKKINLPDDIRNLLNETYQEINGENDIINQLKHDHLAKSQKLKLLALAASEHVHALPMMQDDDEIATRYNTLPTIQVLLVKKIDDLGTAADIILLDGQKLHIEAWKRDFKATVHLHRNTLRIPVYQIKIEQKPFKARYLQKHFNSNTYVLRWAEENGQLYVGSDATPLFYSHEKGIYRQGMSELQHKSIFDTSDFDAFSYEW